jgi:hypothetical protein
MYNISILRSNTIPGISFKSHWAYSKGICKHNNAFFFSRLVLNSASLSLVLVVPGVFKCPIREKLFAGTGVSVQFSKRATRKIISMEN